MNVLYYDMMYICVIGYGLWALESGLWEMAICEWMVWMVSMVSMVTMHDCVWLLYVSAMAYRE